MLLSVSLLRYAVNFNFQGARGRQRKIQDLPVGIPIFPSGATQAVSGGTSTDDSAHTGLDFESCKAHWLSSPILTAAKIIMSANTIAVASAAMAARLPLLYHWPVPGWSPYPEMLAAASGPSYGEGRWLQRCSGVFILWVNLWRYFHLMGSPILI